MEKTKIMIVADEILVAMNMKSELNCLGYEVWGKIGTYLGI